MLAFESRPTFTIMCLMTVHYYPISNFAPSLRPLLFTSHSCSLLRRAVSGVARGLERGLSQVLRPATPSVHGAAALGGANEATPTHPNHNGFSQRPGARLGSDGGNLIGQPATFSFAVSGLKPAGLLGDSNLRPQTATHTRPSASNSPASPRSSPSGKARVAVAQREQGQSSAQSSSSLTASGRVNSVASSGPRYAPLARSSSNVELSRAVFAHSNDDRNDRNSKNAGSNPEADPMTDFELKKQRKLERKKNVTRIKLFRQDS
jgi:hypothetical protein